jgi:hypothetical protein
MKKKLEVLIMQMHESGITYSEAVCEFKKLFILAVLQECKGNQCKAARQVGVHRNTLNRMITELKINVRRQRRAMRPSTGTTRAVRMELASIHATPAHLHSATPDVLDLPQL